MLSTDVRQRPSQDAHAIASGAVARPAPRRLRRIGPASSDRTSRARVLRRTDFLVVAGVAVAAAFVALAPVAVVAVCALTWWWGRGATGLGRLRAGVRPVLHAVLMTVGAGVLMSSALGATGATGSIGVSGPEVRGVLLLVALLGAAHLVSRGVVRLAGGPVRLAVIDDASTGRDRFKGRGSRVVAVGRPALLESPVDGDDPLLTFVRDAGADVVAIAPSALGERDLAAVSRRVGAQEIVVVTAIEGVVERRVAVEGIARGYGRTTVAVAPNDVSRTYRLLASGVDRAFGAVLLMLSAPVLAFVAVVVRLESRGPALFHQERVGRDGERFVMHKFRTMCEDAESMLSLMADLNEVDGAMFKVRNDQRVTRVGRWLRRSSLDELPQFWNVATGQMSMVGPRPALPHEVVSYDDQARRRLNVKPGLTGAWQVNGRSDLLWADAVKLDTAYADNHSIGGDLALCAQTVLAVARGKGAY